MHRGPAAFLTAALLLLSGACSGSGRQPKSSSATTRTAALPTTTTTSDPAADQATARSLLVQAADIPGGWRSSGQPVPALDPGELLACLGRPLPANGATVDGAVLSNGSDRLRSTATVVPSGQQAADDVAALRGPRFVDCAGRLLRERPVTGTGELINVTVAALPLGPSGGPVFGWRGTYVFLAPNAYMSVTYVDTIFVARGRARVTVTVLAVGRPVDPGVEDALAAVVSGRLPPAQG